MYEEYNIRKKLRNDFLEKAREKYKGVYSYPHIFTEFQNSNSYITVICNKHHTTYKTRPAYYLKNSGCKMCMKELMKIPVEEVIRRFKKVHGDWFDYSKMDMNELKPIFICKKHNLEFRQEKRGHLVYNGCPECFKEMRAMTPEKFIKRAKELHGNFYMYDKCEYNGYYNKVTVICPIHGEFQVIAGEHIREPSDDRKPIGYDILRIKDVNSFSTLCELKSKLKDYIKYIRGKMCFKDFLSFKKCYNLPDDANPDDYKQYEYKPR